MEMPLARSHRTVVVDLVSVEAVDLPETHILAVIWRCMLEALHWGGLEPWMKIESSGRARLGKPKALSSLLV